MLIPVFNGEKFIEEALQSVLIQLDSQSRVLCIDDGSTDATPQLLASLSSADHRLIVETNQSNLGLISTLNLGIKWFLERHEQFDFLARMDADDICMPHRFETQLLFMNSNPGVQILGSAVEVFGESIERRIVRLPTQHSEILCAMPFFCPLAHPTIIVRSSLVSALSFSPNWHRCEDFALWMSLSFPSLFDRDSSIPVTFANVGGLCLALSHGAGRFKSHSCNCVAMAPTNQAAATRTTVGSLQICYETPSNKIGPNSSKALIQDVL